MQIMKVREFIKDKKVIRKKLKLLANWKDK